MKAKKWELGRAEARRGRGCCNPVATTDSERESERERERESRDGLTCWQGRAAKSDSSNNLRGCFRRCHCCRRPHPAASKLNLTVWRRANQLRQTSSAFMSSRGDQASMPRKAGVLACIHGRNTVHDRSTTSTCARASVNLLSAPAVKWWYVWHGKAHGLERRLPRLDLLSPFQTYGRPAQVVPTLSAIREGTLRACQECECGGVSTVGDCGEPATYEVVRGLAQFRSQDEERVRWLQLAWTKRRRKGKGPARQRSLLQSRRGDATISTLSHLGRSIRAEDQRLILEHDQQPSGRGGGNGMRSGKSCSDSQEHSVAPRWIRTVPNRETHRHMVLLLLSSGSW